MLSLVLIRFATTCYSFSLRRNWNMPIRSFASSWRIVPPTCLLRNCNYKVIDGGAYLKGAWRKLRRSRLMSGGGFPSGVGWGKLGGKGQSYTSWCHALSSDLLVVWEGWRKLCGSRHGYAHFWSMSGGEWIACSVLFGAGPFLSKRWWMVWY